MREHVTNRTVDLTVVAVANAMNLIMVVVFFLRTLEVGHLLIVGYIWAAFILILAAAVVLNIRARREWWFIVLPLLLAIFLVIEIALDYIAGYDFRSTSLLAPYLVFYYLAILGMIGYAFQTQKKFGFITLATYFLSQIAALYSYTQVGHG